jgi:hypothetical protein
MPILGPLNPVEAVRGFRRAAASAMARARPDHSTIIQRSVMFSPQTMLRLYLYVVVAPSRYAPRAFDDAQVGRACLFATEAFPGVFDATPAAADGDATVFAVESTDGSRERTLYVHRTGLLELLWALALEQPTDEDLILDAVEMSATIMSLAVAVGRRPYAELSEAGRGRRRFARVDWWFHLATAVSGPNGPRHWTGLKFPGATPPRAQQKWPAAPIDGYGYERLRSSRRTKLPTEIASVFLTELLAANGYYDFRNAVAETVEAALGRRNRGG